jgi:hypothetical protein
METTPKRITPQQRLAMATYLHEAMEKYKAKQLLKKQANQ